MLVNFKFSQYILTLAFYLLISVAKGEMWSSDHHCESSESETMEQSPYLHPPIIVHFSIQPTGIWLMDGKMGE